MTTIFRTDDLTTDDPALPGMMTEAAWRDTLVSRLLADEAANLGRASWYLSKQPVPDVPAKYRMSYQLLLDMSRNAWARLVVDAIAERLDVTGVRLRGDDSDIELWNILKRNHIDADQRLAHAEALIFGRSYYSVWPTAEGGVRIVPESGMQVAHESDPADRRMVVAAVKFWRDDVRGVFFANLYLPGEVVKWYAPVPASWTGAAAVTVTAEQMGESLTDAWIELDRVPNPFGEVPMVPLMNRPTLFAGPTSEIDDIEPVLRRTDKLVLDMLLTSDAGAFRQKWATGLKVPRDPNTDKPIEPFDAAVAKLWISESSATSFGSFEASSLDPYLKAIDAQVAQISAISRVPSYYLVSPNLVNPPSADTMTATEAGLIHKAESLQGFWGEAYEAVVRMALRALGDDRADEPGLSVVWADPSMPSKAVMADAAVKWATVGVPQEALWEMGGASPEDIIRWKTIQAREALTQAVLAPVPTVGEAEAVGDEQPQAEAADEVAGA